MIRSISRPALALIAASLVAPACSSEPTSSPATSVFVVPASLDALAGKAFFDQPFPSDSLRREANGSPRYDGWPNPGNVPLVTEFVRATRGIFRGFSPVAAISLRFDGPLDEAYLPTDPAKTASPEATVQLIDVDPASPERGRRRMVMLHWQGAATEMSYWAPNTLSLMPILGDPLRPATRYAAIVTRNARSASGGLVKPNAVLEEVLGLTAPTPATEAARALFAPALAELAGMGVTARQIAHATVFTTDDPTAEAFAVLDDVAKSVPAPSARDMKLVNEGTENDTYEGVYGPSPNYQAGTVPYRKPNDGGAFVFENGVPKVQNTFDLRFALSVPKADKCPPPAAGYPVVLYAHGTGGDYRSFVSDGTARSLATKCLASMGIDQIFHGTRPGAPPENDPTAETTIQFLFFNFDNPTAARTSNRQAAVDVLQQARLFTDSHFTLPAAVSASKVDVAFDGSKLGFFGHSQGGLNGTIFLAGSDLARGAVLSGSGSVLAVALLEQRKPVDIPAAIGFLACGTDPECRDELNLFHPAITMAQSLVDATDPIHYGRVITREPRAGKTPKSIYQTSGIREDGTGDSYAPPRATQALAMTMRLPRIAPGVLTIPEAALLGVKDMTLPAEGVSANIGDGRATGGFAQFTPKAGRDGHFVVFDIPEARAQSAQFLRALADDPKGRLAPP